MCLLQCLVTCEGRYVKLGDILRVVCPMKVNVSYVSSLKSIWLLKTEFAK